MNNLKVPILHAIPPANGGGILKLSEGRAPVVLPAGTLFGCARILLLLALPGWLMVQVSSAQDVIQPTVIPATLPAGILPGSPLAQVVKLAQAAVDEGIIHAYITNSTSTFNLDSDKIIYLKDAGVPNDLVQAMMQRDTTLQAYLTAAGSQPTPSPVTSTLTPATPAPSPVMPDSTPADQSASAPTSDATVNSFYDALAPYGAWVLVPGYGMCWQPSVTLYNADWEPYGDQGNWVYTDSGWYWTSDYSWGWAPFHYGRWFHHEHLGWCWRPDNVWGPSWVTWRYSDDYCGWAPLPPGAYYVDGTGWLFNGGLVSQDYDFGWSPEFYVFVPINDFYGPNPISHRITGSLAGQVYHQTTAVNHGGRNAHGFVNQGIDPGHITQITHLSIRAVPVQTATVASGRSIQGGSALRTGVADYSNRTPSTPGQFDRPGSAPYSGQVRAMQPENWQTQQRSAVPAEVYRSSAPEAEPGRMEPSPESRTFNPSVSAERPEERSEPQPDAQPAQSHNNNSQPAAASSSKSNNKNGN